MFCMNEKRFLIHFLVGLITRRVRDYSYASFKNDFGDANYPWIYLLFTWLAHLAQPTIQRDIIISKKKQWRYNQNINTKCKIAQCWQTTCTELDFCSWFWLLVFGSSSRETLSVQALNIGKMILHSPIFFRYSDADSTCMIVAWFIFLACKYPEKTINFSCSLFRFYMPTACVTLSHLCLSFSLSVL